MLNTPNRRATIARRDGTQCRYCLLRTIDLTLEHLIPLGRGGSKASDNLGLSCERCNHLKADLTDEEFMTWILTGETRQITHSVGMRNKFIRMTAREGTRTVILMDRKRNTR